MTVEESKLGGEVLVCEESSELKKQDNNGVAVVDKEVDGNVAADKEEEEEEEEEEEAKLPKTVEKSSSYKEESNFLSDLKEFERKALAEFKSKVEDAILGNQLLNDNKKEEAKEEGGDKREEPKPEEEEEEREKANDDISLWGIPLLPSKGSEGTDVILLKFLRAREFKVGDAFEMLRKTLRWRKDSGIDSVLDEELCAELGPAAAFFCGADRNGHPVCYNVFGVFGEAEAYRSAFGTEEKRRHFIRWRCQLMERSVRKLDLRRPGGVSSLVHVNDLKNSPGPAKKELRVAVKEAVAMLQDNYPELVAKNIFINVPFWFYALNTLLSPFLTQRTKSKFVVARPGKATETLLKYIPAEEIPVQYCGFKRENDFEFYGDECGVSELFLKAGATETIEIPAPEAGTNLIWDLIVLGWEVTYKEEFVPSDEGSYTIIVQKGKKIAANEGPLRNSFMCNEPGKVVLNIANGSGKKKRVLYRCKTKKASSS